MGVNIFEGLEIILPTYAISNVTIQRASKIVLSTPFHVDFSLNKFYKIMFTTTCISERQLALCAQ